MIPYLGSTATSSTSTSCCADKSLPAFVAFLAFLDTKMILAKYPKVKFSRTSDGVRNNRQRTDPNLLRDDGDAPLVRAVAFKSLSALIEPHA